MSYFEIFDIPVSLKVDTGKLRSRYFELSRKFHPDYFAQAGTVDQDVALERSAELNKAWKTFQDPDETIKYVLMAKGLLVEEEKYELPPDFLLEMLEINESLMDTERADPKLLARIEEIQNEIYAPVHHIIENYSEETATTQELLQVKEYYYKKKYLDRIRKEF